MIAQKVAAVAQFTLPPAATPGQYVSAVVQMTHESALAVSIFTSVPAVKTDVAFWVIA